MKEEINMLIQIKDRIRPISFLNFPIFLAKGTANMKLIANAIKN